MLLAVNMSGVVQKVNFDLGHHGLSSTKTLLSTPKISSAGGVVTLEPFGVFIGHLSKCSGLTPREDRVTP